MNNIKHTIAILSLTSLGLFACQQQGEGEVCQTNGDCKSGLTCNEGTNRCQRPGAATDAAVNFDSAPRADAPELAPDSAPIDELCTTPQSIEACIDPCDIATGEFYWDGTSCLEIICCCEGDDCDQVYDSTESCEDAYTECG